MSHDYLSQLKVVALLAVVNRLHKHVGTIHLAGCKPFDDCLFAEYVTEECKVADGFQTRPNNGCRLGWYRRQ